jgi:hypothetical protein
MTSFSPTFSVPVTTRPSTKSPYFGTYLNPPSTPFISNSYNATLQRQYQRQQRRNHQLNSPQVYRTASSILFCGRCRSDPSAYRRKRSYFLEHFCVLPNFCISPKTVRLRNISRWKVFLGLVFTACMGSIFVTKALCSKWFTNCCMVSLFGLRNETIIRSASNHVSPETVATTSYTTTAQHWSQTLSPPAPENDNHSWRHPLDDATRSPVAPGSMDHLPDWLTSYIEFHRKHVVLVSKRRGHEMTTSYRLNVTDHVRTLTYHCNGVSCGGLGDRLAGIIQAFYMAVCTKRVFLIDWRTPRGGKSLTDYIQPQWIQWNVNGANVMEDEEILLRAMDHRNNTFLSEPNSILQDRSIRLETNLWMGDSFVRSQCWTEFLNHDSEEAAAASNLSEFQLFRTAFNTLFQWSPEVLQSMASLRQRAKLVDSSNFVAMHIRSGLLDAKLLPLLSTNSHVRRHESPSEWMQFLQCSQTLREGISSLCPSNQSSVVDLYLASDDTFVKEYLLNVDPLVKMVVDLDIFHVDQGKTPNDIISWSELVLLQQALCIVKSHSKYSEASAYLSVAPGCAVYFDDCGTVTVAAALSNLRNHDHLLCSASNA